MSLYPKLKNPANPFVGEGQKSVLKSWVITLLIKTVPNFKKSASLIPRKNEKIEVGEVPTWGPRGGEVLRRGRSCGDSTNSTHKT